MQSSDPSKTRALLGARFKIMCADAGLSLEDAADFLHVTPRTVRYWFSGQTFVPYSAYKLLRIYCRYELPGRGWEGWHMHSGKLWTPEGHGFMPADSTWWGLLVRKARAFGVMYARENALHHALNPTEMDALLTPPARAKAAGQTAVVDAGAAVGDPSGQHGLAEQTGIAGRAAKPPRLHLSNKHFGTDVAKIGGLSLEKPPKAEKSEIPHGEKSGVSHAT